MTERCGNAGLMSSVKSCNLLSHWLQDGFCSVVIFFFTISITCSMCYFVSFYTFCFFFILCIYKYSVIPSSLKQLASFLLIQSFIFVFYGHFSMILCIFYTKCMCFSNQFYVIIVRLLKATQYLRNIFDYRIYSTIIETFSVRINKLQ